MVWILWTMKFKSLIQRPSDEDIIPKLKEASVSIAGMVIRFREGY